MVSLINPFCQLDHLVFANYLIFSIVLVPYTPKSCIRKNVYLILTNKGCHSTLKKIPQSPIKP